MSLIMKNETHWRTSDIERIIRDALKEGGGDVSEERIVDVTFPWSKPGNRVSYVYYQVNSTPGRLCVYLPIKGPRSTHPNAMVALAASRDMATTGILNDAVVLAVSDSYFLANALAYEFALEASKLYEYSDCISSDAPHALRSSKRSIQCPSWGDSSRFFIQKYKDPKKDGTYLNKVRKKKAQIKRAETDIAKAEDALAKAKRKLKSAKARKSAAEKSLRGMVARRS